MRFVRASVLLLLVVCHVAPAVALMRPPPITCGMECCIQSGVECCLARDKHNGAQHESDTVLRTAIGSPCPSQCAMVPASIKNAVIRRTPRTTSGVSLCAELATEFEREAFVRDPLISGSVAPRSPPTP